MSGQVQNSLEPFSVSAIETFIACPFRSFANRLLRPATRPCSPELDAMLLGNIAHETLQKYHAGWRLEKSPPDLHALFRSIKNNRTMGLDLSFDDEQDLLRLEGALVFLIETQHDQQKRFDITAERFEWAFGSKTEPLELEHNHRTLPFTGRIDRVEQIGDAYFVLDYKLSSGRIGPKDLPALAAGLLPQLPIYCMAAKQELGFAVAGGQIQRVRQIDRSGFANEDACPASALALFDETDVSVLSDSEYTETIASALDGVFDFCDQMLNGQMEVAPRDPSKTCSLDRCDYFDLCRVSR
jgi:RecB family exonuclease